MTTLYTFNDVGREGTDVESALAVGLDGNLYGTTAQGGDNNNGTVFQVTPSGTLTTLYSFSGTSGDGATPHSALVQGSDQNFYGTTESGGTYNEGSAYVVTSSGALTTLYSFGGDFYGGLYPAAALVQGSDGNFYGTTGQL